MFRFEGTTCRRGADPTAAAGDRDGSTTLSLVANSTNRPAKRRVAGSGRATPKGTKPGEHPDASARYTPPVPKEFKVSPRWVPVMMFALLGIGSVIIIINYLGVLPGGTSNTYLLIGLGLILGAIVTATQWR
jgi:hypothetical protein